MNTYRKGLRIERKAKDFFQRLGYLVARVERLNRYGKSKDLFNLFDLIAINEKEVRLIQTNARKRRHREYMEFASKYPCVKVEQFSSDRGIIRRSLYDDKGGVRMVKLIGSKKEAIIDRTKEIIRKNRGKVMDMSRFMQEFYDIKASEGYIRNIIKQNFEGKVEFRHGLVFID